MKIAIIGTGGVGGYFGSKLAMAGSDVTFIARGGHLEEIQKNGLIVKSIYGDYSVIPVKAREKISDLEQPDLVLLCVKAWQVRQAARELRNVITRNTAILPLQNGISAGEEIAEELSKQCVVGGLCRIMSRIESPGVIHHSGITPTIVLGEFDKVKSERVTKIKDVLEKAGIIAKISDDINAELWKKFIAICISGLLAVTRSTYGVIRELPETRKMMIDLVQEIYDLSQKVGIPIESSFVETTISFIDTFPHDSTSSLTRDVMEGRPSEIEYQNGTVVRLAEKYSLDVPMNKFIYNCILPLEMKARGK